MKEKNDLMMMLKRLKMPGIANNLDIRINEAEDNELGFIEFLHLLIQDEVVSRESNILEKRLKDATFPVRQTFEQFDFSFNREAIPVNIIRDLATCHFIDKRDNLLLCGPPGIGKSHIASAIGHEACRRQMDVIFRKTGKLIEELSDPLYPKRSDRLLKKTISCDLLILDDFAFRKYSQSESELLYTVADERLGKKSTIITSNRPPEDWYSVYPDPVIGGAILDRLISGAIKIIITKGKSYRREKTVVHEQKK
jgi:DNA replication protein DnaC